MTAGRRYSQREPRRGFREPPATRRAPGGAGARRPGPAATPPERRTVARSEAHATGRFVRVALGQHSFDLGAEQEVNQALASRRAAPRTGRRVRHHIGCLAIQACPPPGLELAPTGQPLALLRPNVVVSVRPVDLALAERGTTAELAIVQPQSVRFNIRPATPKWLCRTRGERCHVARVVPKLRAARPMRPFHWIVSSRSVRGGASNHACRTRSPGRGRRRRTTSGRRCRCVPLSARASAGALFGCAPVHSSSPSPPGGSSRTARWGTRHRPFGEAQLGNEPLDQARRLGRLGITDAQDLDVVPLLKRLRSAERAARGCDHDFPRGGHAGGEHAPAPPPREEPPSDPLHLESASLAASAGRPAQPGPCLALRRVLLDPAK